MDGIEPNRIAMDADQVAAVAAYYRRSSLVLAAVADDLAAHDFGRWARTDAGPDAASSLGPSAATYAELSASLSARLRSQSRAAAVLAQNLRASAIGMTAGDAQAAGQISHATPAAEAAPR
ncbi:hypothetical protein RVF83_13855 [Gordonia rubripertincta]|uniref:Uncharacterized protein n=2 Tax=Gordonia rubripertincta TaxID=36822 RepID=A0AAW6R723_GORRU|nr:hypothetical protein [Gordonia rubripertincta]ASR02489.1 hypothetical protein GCWB2_08400 [Gordonia rubripertincta]MDG6780200.1 hypothetical protein [Gordonia rubripertincta]NKY63486.1 hypothetical protein [Gordonia rubripertincta]QMU20403.1 hypothetical protein H3V45_20600 [Gordonia rubripertincta]TSD96888.1 hypothetical protein FOV72_09060 [Gordonia rubripertincta]